jgi:rRNA-processing protein FCF1
MRIVLLAVEREHAITRLQELTHAAYSVLSGAADVPPLELRRSFLRWVSEAEGFFRSSFASVEPSIGFDSPRLVALQGGRIASDQIYVVLQAEGARLITQLEAAIAALTSPFPASTLGHDRTIVVLDTNTLLQYRNPDQTSWQVLTGAPEVLLVVPLVVLDELDDKRNAKDTSLARRARNIASTIEQWTASARADSPTELAEGVAILVLSEESGHRRLPNNDDEIIAVARSLADRGETVLVATADGGMRTRARARGVGVLMLPDDHRLKTPDPVERENIALRRQLDEMRVRHPALRVLAIDGRDHVVPSPPKDARRDDPERIVAQLAAEHPPLQSSTMRARSSARAMPFEFGPPLEQSEEYASARDAWLARCRVAVQQRNDYREIRAGAIELSLVVHNGGQATAGDVLVELRLVDDKQHWLCRPDELAEPPLPKPPPKPTSTALFDYSPSLVTQSLDPTVRLDPSVLQNLGGNDTWSFSKDRHLASLHIQQVRHGALDVTLPGLLLLSRDEKVARGGVTLHWRCLGVAPTVSDSGELHVTPRAGDISGP